MNPRKKTQTKTFFEILERYPREYFVFAFFFLFFFAIVWETFSYTVSNYDFYEKLAYNQQVWEVEVPVTRGTIYTDKSETMSDGTVLSTSVDLNDLAIDPQIEWNKEKLILFLTDILYKEMCYLKDNSDCYDDMLRFLKVLEIGDFEANEEYLKGRILKRLQQKISKTKVTSVKLLADISPEQEKTVLEWNIPWVYPGINGLYVNPEELKQKELFVNKYIELFGWVYKDIDFKVRSRDLRYIPIYNKLSLLWSDEIEQYIRDESQISTDKADSIGWFIILTPHAQRIYPERSVGSQIVGFIDNSGTGRYGLEGYFDDILRGNPWEQIWKKDIRGRTIEPISFWNEDAGALEGADIQTTIDRNVQKKVEEILEAGVKKYRANKWTIVVMQPKTGKILSLANYPSYDPNSPGEVYDLERITPTNYPNPTVDLLWKSVLIEDVERWDKYFYDGREIFLREALRTEYGNPDFTKYVYKNSFGAGVYQNEAISSIYEPGSIMKAITVAIGIDSWEIQAYDMYNDTWEVTIDRFTIKNVSSACLWYNSFAHALSYSCNVWMIRIAQRIGKALFHKYLVDFWFDEKTGITLKWEVSSKMDPYEKWPTSRLLTSSFWLWVSATPLQMAAAYSVIANGGVYMKPYIVDTISFTDGQEIIYKPQAVRRVLKEVTSQIVTKMLVSWVDTGVAKNGAVPGYSVAGKTGTAQIAYRGDYERGVASTYASFAGYAPAEDPQFVVVVKLDRPRTSEFWWETSAFLFSEVTKGLLEYYSIPKKEIE